MKKIYQVVEQDGKTGVISNCMSFWNNERSARRFLDTMMKLPPPGTFVEFEKTTTWKWDLLPKSFRAERMHRYCRVMTKGGYPVVDYLIVEHEVFSISRLTPFCRLHMPL